MCKARCRNNFEEIGEYTICIIVLGGMDTLGKQATNLKKEEQSIKKLAPGQPWA